MKKKIIITVCALILLGAAIFAAIHFIDIKTPEEYYSEDDKEKENVIGSVTISIRCDRVIGMAEHIPSDGIILDTATFDIEEGDTVYSILIEAAKKYGMTFEASILSPLDVGGGWIKQSDETGFTYQYLETDVKPDGSYCADMRCQRQWNNNKGPIHPIPYKVLAFAFNEERVGDTPYFYVDENAIVDISETASYAIEAEKTTTSTDGYATCPMTISGKWDAPTANRVLCVMVYRMPELDYFAPSALEFTKKVMDDHNAAGITYEGFYSDEMHIQFDWDLERHFGETEINTRYLTPAFMKAYADRYGEKYLDFPKYLIYMAYHQHDFLPGEEGKENAQHVFGKAPQDIANTWLFRNRYFELLQRTVVDLSKEAKDYAESLWGGPIMTRAHATWQESPTCDHYYHQPNAIGGFDVQDIRLGGLMARIQTAREVVLDYLNGEIDRIEELEQERLPFVSEGSKSKNIYYNSWLRMVTANKL